MTDTLRFGIVVITAFLVWALRGMPRDLTPKSEVDFAIVTDRVVYPPGSVAHVKFIVTNKGETPLYLHRPLTECSGQKGFILFQMLDRENRSVDISRCSADSWPPLERAGVFKEVSDPRFWVLLQQWEIYGGESDIELPTKKGIYRLKAELIPPAFSDDQRKTLSQNRTRVLQSSRPAPVVTITIK